MCYQISKKLLKICQKVAPKFRKVAQKVAQSEKSCSKVALMFLYLQYTFDIISNSISNSNIKEHMYCSSFYIITTMAEKGLPSFRDSEFPSFRVSEIPSFRDSEFPRFRVSEIPSFRDSEFPRFRDSEFPRFRDWTFLSGIWSFGNSYLLKTVVYDNTDFSRLII